MRKWHMNRFFYTLLLYFTLPFVPLKLFWRGLKQPDYRKYWAERFGFYSKYLQNSKPIICLHCVSVGETRAAAPLIKKLLEMYPNYSILLTHTTPTGRETSMQLFGDAVMRVYLPYDLPFAVTRFLNHFKPAIVLLMETELWFNLIAECKNSNTPCLLINARLSEKSSKGYKKLGLLTQEGLLNLSAVAAQTAADAERLTALGANNVSVFGNLKFDVALPNNIQETGLALRNLLGVNSLIFVAASTRDGEEVLILDALMQLNIPSLVTVIVPRHPQRFDEVASILQARGLSYEKRSRLSQLAYAQPTQASIKFVLGDSMGELLNYYAACDVAFVGGSLLPFGGQNLIEPCALGKPALIGPYTFNFELATELAIIAGAVLRVQTAEALVSTLKTLLESEVLRRKMANSGLNFVAEHTGATDKTMQLLSGYLNQP